MADQSALPDFDKMWDYYNPSETRQKFLELVPQSEASGDLSYYLQLLTQIARTYSLEAKFDSCAQYLDRTEELMKQGQNIPLVEVRYNLEKGRYYNSQHMKVEALPYFEKSFEIADSIGADYFAIDAAHMAAIAETDKIKKRDWHLLALDKAVHSGEEKARKWQGSLYNNLGWDLHEEGEYERALNMFEKALEFHLEQGKQPQLNIAKWSVGRCLRSLERYEAALMIQHALLKYNNEHDSGDGYVQEELGELYLAINDSSKAELYFAQAYELLSKDNWLVTNEPDRLERIKKLGGVE